MSADRPAPSPEVPLTEARQRAEVLQDRFIESLRRLGFAIPSASEEKLRPRVSLLFPFKSGDLTFNPGYNHNIWGESGITITFKHPSKDGTQFVIVRTGQLLPDEDGVYTHRSVIESRRAVEVDCESNTQRGFAMAEAVASQFEKFETVERLPWAD